jgi:ABC-type uncharacterized transport system substrate-binding protein
MKRLKTVWVLLGILTAGVVSADVAILKVEGVVAFEEAVNGFGSVCFEPNQKFDLNEDLSNKDAVVNAIRSGNFAVIFAIGTQAAEFARHNFPSIPIVFAFVMDPKKLGFTKDNSTGVSLTLPIREQFIVLKSINKKIERVGVIYTKDRNEAILSEAREAAEREDLEVVAQAIQSSQDLQRAMTALIGRVTALWIPPDPSLNSEDAIKYIGSKSLENKIPCVGPNDRYVRSGAIFSYSVDTIETGRMAGEMANKILQGTPVSRLPFQEVQRPKVIINLKAAGLLGLTIPENLQNAASKIYQ